MGRTTDPYPPVRQVYSLLSVCIVDDASDANDVNCIDANTNGPGEVARELATGGEDEAHKDGRWAQRPRLELGMELYRNIVRVPWGGEGCA
jgi:hypothetical protein